MIQDNSDSAVGKTDADADHDWLCWTCGYNFETHESKNYGRVWETVLERIDVLLRESEDDDSATLSTGTLRQLMRPYNEWKFQQVFKDLSVRAMNILLDEDVTTLTDLCRLSPDELLALHRKMTPEIVNDIQSILANVNLALRDK